MDAEDQRRIDNDDRASTVAENSAPRLQRHPWRFARRRGCRRHQLGPAASFRRRSAARRPAPPTPMMNIVVSAGAHADNPIDIQEFMIMPIG
ncbi:MAG: hypothetical protein R3C27_16340 [Hyphomonadaceae bacterium]